jgi:hypothetical protein
MASKLSSQLTHDAQSSKGNLGDFSHASNLFVDSNLRLAPKVKFLYHVVFGINTTALISTGFKFKHQTEVNMLVKSVDLPSFNMQADTINQYNRKKVFQTKIDYTPVTIKFHDDSFGVTRLLWENYYQYYFADSKSAGIFNSYDPRNSTKTGKLILSPYGLDNKSTKPFFKFITIYQLSKGEWNSYTLVNPMIQSWRHDNLSYSENAPVEHSATLIYESVIYDSGTGKPPTFATEHYDTVRSPLTLSTSSATNNGVVTSTQLSDIPQTARPAPDVSKMPVIMQALTQGKRTVTAATAQPDQKLAGGILGISFPGKTNL